MDSKQCLHYNEEAKLCKFGSGNCGNRGIRRTCRCDGHPARSMRDEKETNFNFMKKVEL